MQLKITHQTRYTYSDAVPVCHNMANLLPRDSSWQTCQSYQLLVVPEPSEKSQSTDYFGNRVDHFSILEAHRGLTVTATSLVKMDAPTPRLDPASSPPWETVALPDCLKNPLQLDGFPFRFASRLTPVGADYADYARVSFQPGRPILAAALELTQRIHDDFKYDPRATTVSTPVQQVFAQRAGVCQDFAHLQNACFRSLGLAARYVSGYLRTLPPPGKPRLIGADASHAWVALECGPLGWVDLDPTNNVIPSADHVTIALGRDYHDCCPLRGVYVGGGNQTLEVSVDVHPISA